MGTSSSRRRESQSQPEEPEREEEPTVVNLSSGMRVVVSSDSGDITIFAPQGTGRGQYHPDSSESEDEEVSMPTLQLLSRLLGIRNRMEREDVPLPQPTPMNPSCELYREVMYATGQQTGCKRNVCQQVASRQLLHDIPSHGQRVATTVDMIPRYPCLADIFDSRAFCGTFSKDGSVFVSACQDQKIYLYDTAGEKFRCYRSVRARDVGWSILDVAFSPDQNWFVYSTWSPCVHLCNVHGEEEHHYSLDMNPDQEDRFCAFAVRFSSDNREILASASDGYLYIYDREKYQRTLKIDAHQDDANAVVFADESSQVIYSGGDDGVCKVWDRRALSEASPTPVGIFAGHKDGITFIDPKGDGRYLLTNSKDQSIKLWDVRRFSSGEGLEATLCHVSQQDWDYRYMNVPQKTRAEALVRLPGDTSVMTYAGHWVKHTLLRARFSPTFTTGQRYIYAACAKGRVIIYDILTGGIVETLTSENLRSCIRDVSWHPYEPGLIAASSWDGCLQLWTYNKRPDIVTDCSFRRLFHYF